mgnify:CR=1 FL=1
MAWPDAPFTRLSIAEKIIVESIKSQLISDVPLGTFLSGGLDSSTILKFALEINPKIKSFTINYDSSLQERNDDLFYAKKISKHLNCDLEIINISQNTGIRYIKYTYTSDSSVTFDDSISSEALHSINGEIGIDVVLQDNFSIFFIYERS